MSIDLPHTKLVRDSSAPGNGKPILAGTDFSATASVAVGRAASLARDGHRQLEIMHAIALGDAPVYRVSGWEANRRDIVTTKMAKLQELAAEVEAEFRIPVRRLDVLLAKGM